MQRGNSKNLKSSSFMGPPKVMSGYLATYLSMNTDSKVEIGKGKNEEAECQAPNPYM